MQHFGSLQHGNTLFDFQPPVKIHSAERIETIGQLVGASVVGDLVITNYALADKISRPIQEHIDTLMSVDSYLGIERVQQELKGRHEVTATHLPLLHLIKVQGESTVAL